MSLIEINPDVRKATAALERIATALELLLVHGYGIVPPSQLARTVTTGPASADDIGYATNESTLKQELEALVMPQTVRERDGNVVEEEVGDTLR